MPTAHDAHHASEPALSAGSRRRYRRILRFAAWHLLVIWWFELVLPRFGLSRWVARGRDARSITIARRFRGLALDLQGLMIKMGQFLSSRLDVFPPEVTRQLAGLQDEVPPAPVAEIMALAAEELGVEVGHAFDSFEHTPLAAASLGQAHRAQLNPSLAAEVGFRDVVVKVQRPGIDEIVRVDLAALRRVAQWVSRIRLVADRTDAPALLEEFAETSLEEIDYLHEAASAERFAQNLGDDPRVSVPEMVWERSTRRVLTMRDVSAIKINDVAALRAAGIDPQEVATHFATVMLDQLFIHRFFHGDPHPGNVFVTPAAPGEPRGNWRLTFIDFGMMGEIPTTLRTGLRSVVIAVATRNGKALVASAQEVGVLLPSANTVALEEALVELFSRFGGMGFADLQRVDPREFKDFATEFSDIVRALPFQLPENFLLMIRAVSLVSGVCSSLEPEFNMWSAVEPYAASLASEQSMGGLHDAAEGVWTAATTAARLPGRVDELITRAERGELSMRLPRVERRLSALELSVRRLVSVLLFAVLLLGGVLLRAEEAVLSTVLFALSVVPLTQVLFARART